MSRTRQLQGSGSAGHPVGSPCKGLLAPASKQPLPALPPPCRQAGEQVPASRSPHCQQACPAKQRASSQAPVGSFPHCQQACPAQQRAGSQAPVPSVFYLVAQPGRRVVHTLPYRRRQYLASLPCTAAGGQPGSCEQFPLCQQACPTQQRGGQSGSSEQFPLCQQATPAGRLAGGRASTSRLLPHDPFRQASSTRLPFQDFSRAARLRYY